MSASLSIDILIYNYGLVLCEFLDFVNAEPHTRGYGFKRNARKDEILSAIACLLLNALFTTLFETFAEALLHAEVPNGVKIVYECFLVH